jgi:hypothetical protein
VSPSGRNRSGYGRYHSSWIQSFQARITACPSSGSSEPENTDPQNPAMDDGKFMDDHTPAMSMSRTRAAASKQPGRISLNDVGSNRIAA